MSMRENQERTSGLAWISREDSWACWRLPVLFFAVVTLLPCGAHGDSMCDEMHGLSQHPQSGLPNSASPPSA